MTSWCVRVSSRHAVADMPIFSLCLKPQLCVHSVPCAVGELPATFGVPGVKEHAFFM
jgi:hypothetical protein